MTAESVFLSPPASLHLIMASYYVYSGAGGAGTGADWANAYTSLATALSGKAAGDVFYVADDHAESSASTITMTAPSGNPPVLILCVRRSGGSVPPVSADLRTTATITSTGSAGIALNGTAYVYGVKLLCGTGGNSSSITLAGSAAVTLVMENCSLSIVATGVTARIFLGGTAGAAKVVLINTPVGFGSTSQGINVRTPSVWKNTPSALIGTAPTAVFVAQSDPGRITVDGVDLSAASRLVTLNTTPDTEIILNNCIVPSTLVSSSPSGDSRCRIKGINCDTGDVQNRYFDYGYRGNVDTENTIVRSGGASDGITPTSRKLVSSSVASFTHPLESDEIECWNETTGSSVTVTVEVVTDGVTLKDDECYLEVEYLGTSNQTLASRITDAKADILATGANQASSSVTWTTTGLSSPVKQALSVTFTPQEKGLVRARVKLGKASTTVYVDPHLQLQSGRTYQAGSTYINEPATSADYPDEDDVRDGVSFDSGNLTGNLVLPAEADVESGVQYGTNGTEFTGELAGGGGNTYSRGRVVNG